jgi:hypothetical protein
LKNEPSQRRKQTTVFFITKIGKEKENCIFIFWNFSEKDLFLIILRAAFALMYLSTSSGGKL